MPKLIDKSRFKVGDILHFPKNYLDKDLANKELLIKNIYKSPSNDDYYVRLEDPKNKGEFFLRTLSSLSINESAIIINKEEDKIKYSKKPSLKELEEVSKSLKILESNNELRVNQKVTLKNGKEVTIKNISGNKIYWSSDDGTMGSVSISNIKDDGDIKKEIHKIKFTGKIPIKIISAESKDKIILQMRNGTTPHYTLDGLKKDAKFFKLNESSLEESFANVDEFIEEYGDYIINKKVVCCEDVYRISEIETDNKKNGILLTISNESDKKTLYIPKNSLQEFLDGDLIEDYNMEFYLVLGNEDISEEFTKNDYSEIEKLAKLNGIELSNYNQEQILKGLEVELEHGSVNPITNVTNDDIIKTLKIVLAHLNEKENYYDLLEKHVEKKKQYEKLLLNKVILLNNKPLVVKAVKENNGYLEITCLYDITVIKNIKIKIEDFNKLLNNEEVLDVNSKELVVIENKDQLNEFRITKTIKNGKFNRFNPAFKYEYQEIPYDIVIEYFVVERDNSLNIAGSVVSVFDDNNKHIATYLKDKKSLFTDLEDFCGFERKDNNHLVLNENCEDYVHNLLYLITTGKDKDIDYENTVNKINDGNYDEKDKERLIALIKNYKDNGTKVDEILDLLEKMHKK